MIRVSIVEDQEQDINILKKYLTQYGKEHKIDFLIQVFHDGIDIVSDYSAEHDIILLDIQMMMMNGMKTAEKIREIDSNVVLIFITATASFAIQGYLVDALGYVLKPVSYLAFSQLISKAVNAVTEKQTHDSLLFSIDGGRIHLNVSQIYYLESQKHNVVIHSEKGDFVTVGPLKKIEPTLHPKGFSKCHNAYLVNLKHVLSIVKNNIILPDNTELPISRNRKKTFMEDLAAYIGGTL